jgi:hypothetical protein
MKYTLITPQGRVYTFYLETVAQTYLQAYGGTLFNQEVLVDTETQTVYN